MLFTACNEVGARLMFHRRVWFCSQGGCLPQCMLGYPPGIDPPEQTPTRSRHPSRADTPSPQSRHPLPRVQSMLGDTANARAVRILLECNLVIHVIQSAYHLTQFTTVTPGRRTHPSKVQADTLEWPDMCYILLHFLSTVVRYQFYTFNFWTQFMQITRFSSQSVFLYHIGSTTPVYSAYCNHWRLCITVVTVLNEVVAR